MSHPFLSHAWADALTAAAAEDRALPGLIGPITSRIAVDVPDAPHGPVRIEYTFATRTATVTTSAGRAGTPPEAVLTMDYATAAAMGRGTMGPMAAYGQGRVTLSGDAAKVLPVIRVLERLNTLNTRLGTRF